MSSDKITVELKEREVVRKGLNQLRSSGTVPAVIHDHGKPSILVSGDYVRLAKIYSQAGRHHPVHLKVGNKQRLALIKDVDFEPTKRQIRHVVFQAIRQNEKATAEIPVVLVGEEIPAEKSGYMILKQLNEVKVEALPTDLPDEITVDATKLAEVGDRLTVADLQVPSGVTVLVEPEHSIAVVEIPRDQVAEADAAREAMAEDAGKPADEAALDPEAPTESDSSQEASSAS